MAIAKGLFGSQTKIKKNVDLSNLALLAKKKTNWSLEVSQVNNSAGNNIHKIFDLEKDQMVEFSK